MPGPVELNRTAVVLNRGSVATRDASISSDLLADSDARVEPEQDEERPFRSVNALS